MIKKEIKKYVNHQIILILCLYLLSRIYIFLFKHDFELYNKHEKNGAFKFLEVVL